MKKLMNIIIVACLLVGIIYVMKRDDEKVIVEEIKKIIISVNDRDLIVELEKNSSANAFYNRLKKESITIKTHDNGNYEKIGNLEFELPRNDETNESKSGDLFLYNGNQITLFYDTNKFKSTKLGHVTNLDSYELKELLGSGDLIMKFSVK